ncbi:MAG: glycosyltransferase [Myxococcales bacterium]|nr:MAG: glycosyltransferase [Myxococcales bacterium]
MAQVSRPPLRIFHLIKSLGRGGAEMLLTDAPAVSDPHSFQYGFGYFLPHKRALVAELEEKFGHVMCFPASSGLGMLAQASKLARHLRAWRADVLHCHLPLAGVVGRLAGRLAKVPVVYTEHNVLERYHPATRTAARLTWPLQRRVIAVSADVKASIVRRFGERVPVQVILNGVSLERFSRNEADGAALRERWGIQPDAFVVGTVAVFRKQKRLDVWLEVAKRVAERDPKARFLLVGDGPLRAEVETKVRALGLGAQVILPGLEPQVVPYLAAMDAYLMSSDFEGVPIALLEAMAMQLPPVVTRAGGIPEVVEHTVSGLLHERGDAVGLAASLLQLLEAGPEARRAMGHRARERIASGFSTVRMTRELEEVYRRAAQG